jgi:hypothetical protein
MKNGGADLRVLHPKVSGKIVSHLRAFVDVLHADVRSPSAYIAVAYWANDKEPWLADYNIAWDTESAQFPHYVLFERAAALLATDAAAQIAEHRVMETLGYKRTDDDPDSAA